MKPESDRIITHTVSRNEEGMSVSQVMKDILLMSSKEITRCKQFDDGILVRMADQGEDTLKKAFVRQLLHEGDVLRIRIYEDTDNSSPITPTDVPINIVYEDEDLILVNKPGDMVVHPSYAHPSDSLSNALLSYYIKTSQNHVIRAIGRLDRETSGLIIFAKNRHSAAVYSKQNQGMSRRKEYLALARGVFEKESGTVDAPIGLPEGTVMKREVMSEGKEAVTHFRVIRQYEDFALIKLILDTGRTHQIRVHMSHIGHPLLGDSLYGGKSSAHGIERAALHAAHLEFVHPITGEGLSFDADLPEDMKRLLNNCNHNP